MSSLVFMLLRVKLLEEHHADTQDDVAFYRGIICILNDHVGVRQRYTLMGKQGVEQ